MSLKSKPKQLNKKSSNRVELDEDLAEILGILSVMARDTSSSDAYLRELAHGLVNLTEAQFVISYLALARGNETIFVVSSSAGNFSEIDLNTISIIGDQGILEQAWVTKKPILENQVVPQDVISNFYPDEISVEEPISVMCSPILKGKKCFGLILVGSKPSCEFSPVAFTGLQHAAAGAGLYLHNSGLLEQISSLFYDLDYMIQEWASDVSERLDKVQKNGIFLGKILTDLSHEFKTPIASLSLYLGLVQKRPEKSEQYLDTMQTVISRLESLLDGILDLSEFRLKVARINLQSVQMNQIFSEISTQFENLPDGTKISITTECDSRIWVTAEKNYLLRAVTELVENAVKYGDGEEIKLSAEYDEVDFETMILIKVSDKGPGIPIRDVNYIFNPFYRGYGVGQSSIFGAGLGLTFANEVINSFGGSLVLGDTFGAGTTMEIRLLPSS